MSEDRRTFLKEAGLAALGLGCGLPLVRGAFAITQHGSDREAQSSSRLDHPGITHINDFGDPGFLEGFRNK